MPAIPVKTIISIGFVLNFFKQYNDIINMIIAVKFRLVVFIFIIGDSKKAIKIIVEAEDAISPIEEECNPFKMFEILSVSLYLLKNLYKSMERMNPDKTQPNVATIAPNIPAIRIPTKVEVLTAKGPGVIWDIVIISVSSCNESQLR